MFLMSSLLDHIPSMSQTWAICPRQQIKFIFSNISNSKLIMNFAANWRKIALANVCQIGQIDSKSCDQIWGSYEFSISK